MAERIAARLLLTGLGLGPVLLSALRRLASICRDEIMAGCFAIWVYFVI
jgi:hypothetical protein